MYDLDPSLSFILYANSGVRGGDGDDEVGDDDFVVDDHRVKSTILFFSTGLESDELPCDDQRLVT